MLLEFGSALQLKKTMIPWFPIVELCHIRWFASLEIVWATLFWWIESLICEEFKEQFAHLKFINHHNLTHLTCTFSPIGYLLRIVRFEVSPSPLFLLVKVDVPKSNIARMWTPIFELYVVLRMDTKKTCV